MCKLEGLQYKQRRLLPSSVYSDDGDAHLPPCGQTRNDGVRKKVLRVEVVVVDRQPMDDMK